MLCFPFQFFADCVCVPFNHLAAFCHINDQSFLSLWNTHNHEYQSGLLDGVYYHVLLYHVFTCPRSRHIASLLIFPPLGAEGCLGKRTHLPPDAEVAEL